MKGSVKIDGVRTVGSLWRVLGRGMATIAPPFFAEEKLVGVCITLRSTCNVMPVLHADAARSCPPPSRSEQTLEAHHRHTALSEIERN